MHILYSYSYTAYKGLCKNILFLFYKYIAIGHTVLFDVFDVLMNVSMHE